MQHITLSHFVVRSGHRSAPTGEGVEPIPAKAHLPHMTKAAYLTLGVLLSSAAAGQVPTNVPAGNPLGGSGRAIAQAATPTNQLTQAQRAAVDRAAADVARRQAEARPETAPSGQQAVVGASPEPSPSFDVNVPDEPAKADNSTSPYGGGIRLPWSRGIRTGW
jgi:hypothetical protein